MPNCHKSSAIVPVDSMALSSRSPTLPMDLAFFFGIYADPAPCDIGTEFPFPMRFMDKRTEWRAASLYGCIFFIASRLSCIGSLFMYIRSTSSILSGWLAIWSRFREIGYRRVKFVEGLPSNRPFVSTTSDACIFSASSRPPRWT